MSAALSNQNKGPEAVERARDLVREAVALLDAARAPADIAAHLEVAIHRMTSEIGTS